MTMQLVIYPKVDHYLLKWVLMESVAFSVLVGKTLREIVEDKDSNVIVFKLTCGQEYYMFHKQDCCETVQIDDICGDLQWLLDTPVLVAEERSNEEESVSAHRTWTFYEIATIKGSVTIRWWGASNGYYSERVSFKKVMMDS